MSVRKTRYRAIAALFLFMAACRDVAGPEAAIERGFHPILILGDSGEGFAITSLALVSRGITDRLGAVQGVLEYDTTALRLEHADVAGRAVGHVGEFRPGTIRFAVAAPAGLDGEPMFGFRWSVSDALEPRSFSIRFESVVSVDFVDLRSSVVGTEGLPIQDH